VLLEWGIAVDTAVDIAVDIAVGLAVDTMVDIVVADLDPVGYTAVADSS
jgi:hypothetical protein